MDYAQNSHHHLFMRVEEVEIRSLLHRVVLNYNEDKHERTDKIRNITGCLSYLVDKAGGDGDWERE